MRFPRPIRGASSRIRPPRRRRRRPRNRSRCPARNRRRQSPDRNCPASETEPAAGAAPAACGRRSRGCVSCEASGPRRGRRRSGIAWSQWLWSRRCASPDGCQIRSTTARRAARDTRRKTLCKVKSTAGRRESRPPRVGRRLKGPSMFRQPWPGSYGQRWIAAIRNARPLPTQPARADTSSSRCAGPGRMMWRGWMGSASC